MTQELTYLKAYPDHLQDQVKRLIKDRQLAALLLKKYPATHEVRTDKALYQYVQGIKNAHLRNGEQISKIVYDNKLHVIKNALGTHTYVSRIQGNKLKSKHEIRVASLFKQVPEEFLKMIVVHELAHLKEKEHDKAFYQLCSYMEPNYHQYELDLRLYLTQVELFGDAVWNKAD
ncbi:MAG: M48 family metallopeptidase [Undibacterium sp.]|nr:M48 family metallopeptidase [Undibacterium sp.]MDO8701229.1 M48 family metallopeptidase [Undibacterium sp.]